MHDRSLSYRIPGASWRIEIPSDVVDQLSSFAQKGWQSKEAVGQLYSADVAGQVLRLARVTKLKPRWAGYAGVRLDLGAVVRERAALFQLGLHCLGFWHSHPEPIPHLSPEDLAMAAEQAMAGHPDFQGIIFMILGTAPLPSGIGVWVHDGITLWQAELVSYGD